MKTKIKLETIASGFQFTEGPLWHNDGYLLFSDTPANCIYKLTGNKATSFITEAGYNGLEKTFLSDMTGPNGIAMLPNSNLIICQHGNHALAAYDGKKLLPLINTYEGKPLNSPNDVCVTSNGYIYFTDPPYGLKGQVLMPSKFQPHAGLYLLKNNELHLLYSKFAYPNGVCVSPNEKYLYLSSNNENDESLKRFVLDENGFINNEETFIEQNADGIATDASGRLYLATMEGIKIYNDDGDFITNITVPEMATNIAIDNTTGNLYITAGGNVYTVAGICNNEFIE
jgi:gluconolactonase